MVDRAAGIDPAVPDLAADGAVVGSVAGGTGGFDPDAVGESVACLVRIARVLAAAVGVVAAVVLAEYAMGRSFGLDRVWFEQALSSAESSWPGRPKAQTAVSTLLLSVVVALTQVNRR